MEFAAARILLTAKAAWPLRLTCCQAAAVVCTVGALSGQLIGRVGAFRAQLVSVGQRSQPASRVLARVSRSKCLNAPRNNNHLSRATFRAQQMSGQWCWRFARSQRESCSLQRTSFRPQATQARTSRLLWLRSLPLALEGRSRAEPQVLARKTCQALPEGWLGGNSSQWPVSSESRTEPDSLEHQLAC